MTMIRNACARSLPARGGTWHPHHGNATIWMTGTKHVTPDGGVIYPKTLYPPRYYKFGYEKITNPDDLYDAHVMSSFQDGCTFFKPEYKMFKGQQRRRGGIKGYKSSTQAPRFCWKNPEKVLNVWHADDSMVYDHISTLQRIKWFFQQGSWSGRVGLWMNIYPMLFVKAAHWIEKHREPQEIFIDREEYYRNWKVMYYGVMYDHHKYAHMLAKRRTNKWHYDDVTLMNSHH